MYEVSLIGSEKKLLRTILRCEQTEPDTNQKEKMKNNEHKNTAKKAHGGKIRLTKSN